MSMFNRLGSYLNVEVAKREKLKLIPRFKVHVASRHQDLIYRNREIIRRNFFGRKKNQKILTS